MRLRRVYCGRTRRGGEPVTEREFTEFLTDTVSKTLSAFTVVAANGYWQSESEESSVIEWVDSTDEGEAEVARIAIAYKHRFNQDAVLVTASELEASLI